MTRARLLSLGVLATLATTAGVAWPCGGSGPGGTGGCELDLSRTKPRSRIGASFVATDTTLLFGEGRRAEMRRAVAFASLAVPVSSRFSFQASLGAFVTGDLRTPTSKVTLGPGVASSIGVGFRMLDGRGSAPLVLTTLTYSSTHVSARPIARHFAAHDVRASLVIGKTIADVVTPYALARAFGGPAFWRWDDGKRVTGTDLYKYQVGGGIAATVGPVELFVEGTPLGERTLGGGAAIAL